MLAELRRVRYPFETCLLLAFCVFLPLLEFWKNLALLAFFITWIVNRLGARDLGGGWRTSDWVVIFWVGGAYLAAAFAGLPGNAWSKTGDLALTALLFWMVVRAGYGEREARWVIRALVAATLVGLAVGYARLWSGVGKSGDLQLNSVGHVNHSAIYMAIVTGALASWVLACWQSWSWLLRGLACAALSFMLVSLVVTASRAAVGVGFLMLLLLGLAWWPRWRAPLAAALLVSSVGAALAVGLDTGLVRKQVENEANQNVLSYRDGIWRMGLAAWEKYPWFGVGKDNYGRVTHEMVKAWRAEAGKPYAEADYVRFPHAHSLYVNTLAERGVVGLVSLAAVLLFSLAALLRHRPRPSDGDLAWLLWGGAASAWIITCGVGLVNTTLHHEHGMLAALLMGLWLSTVPPRRAS
jgi:O-antigen ligase